MQDDRVVPEFWGEYADAWLPGFDGVSIQGAGKAAPVGDQMEAEVDEAGVSKLPAA
ncbi:MULTISPECIES: hypothetical protein [unclassified Mesorhizobium]|uniref:hypothetical protein n=1 Tax=unclassified Mesorhizobium TaxID=325217 RepID=UPI0013E359D3|nr:MULTISPECIES: hypothetical protein [unclassified Mesorhizobium]